jgi:cytoskeletal protein CcmA (bactofilin family)
MFGVRKASSPAPTVIGKGTLIEGTVRVAGPVQVDGVIEGALIAEGHVSIGPTGAVLGELVAAELDLGGRAEGHVQVRDHLRVAPGAVARGHVRYGTLEVVRGGIIDGSALQTEAHASESDPALPAAVGSAPTPAVAIAFAETTREPAAHQPSTHERAADDPAAFDPDALPAPSVRPVSGTAAPTRRSQRTLIGTVAGDRR